MFNHFTRHMCTSTLTKPCGKKRFFCLVQLSKQRVTKYSVHNDWNWRWPILL